MLNDKKDVRSRIIDLIQEIGEINIEMTRLDIKNLTSTKNLKEIENQRKRNNTHILINIEIQKKLKKMSKFIARDICGVYPKDAIKNAITYVKRPTDLQRTIIESLLEIKKEENKNE